MSVVRAVEGVASLVEQRALSRDVAQLTFKVESPEGFAFKPGQFINLFLPQEEGKRPVFRSYSLINPASDATELTLLLDTDVPGPGVGYLTSLKPHDKVKFKGPLGIFVPKEVSERPVLMVTQISAVGVSLNVVESLLLANANRQVTFLYEPKQSDAILLWERIDRLRQTYPGFQPVITCADAGAEWKGPRVSLHDEALRRVTDPQNLDVFIVGLGSMVVKLKDAMKERGIPPERIVSEKWTKGDDD